MGERQQLRDKVFAVPYRSAGKLKGEEKRRRETAKMGSTVEKLKRRFTGEEKKA